MISWSYEDSRVPGCRLDIEYGGYLEDRLRGGWVSQVYAVPLNPRRLWKAAWPIPVPDYTVFLTLVVRFRRIHTIIEIYHLNVPAARVVGFDRQHPYRLTRLTCYFIFWRISVSELTIKLSIIHFSKIASVLFSIIRSSPALSYSDLVSGFLKLRSF